MQLWNKISFEPVVEGREIATDRQIDRQTDRQAHTESGRNRQRQIHSKIDR